MHAYINGSAYVQLLLMKCFGDDGFLRDTVTPPLVVPSSLRISLKLVFGAPPQTGPRPACGCIKHHATTQPFTTQNLFLVNSKKNCTKLCTFSAVGCLPCFQPLHRMIAKHYYHSTTTTTTTTTTIITEMLFFVGALSGLQSSSGCAACHVVI